jgi:hypothetical protein
MDRLRNERVAEEVTPAIDGAQNNYTSARQMLRELAIEESDDRTRFRHDFDLRTALGQINERFPE